MNIKIDGKAIRVEDSTKNIVEIAEDNGLTIVAPCFRNKKKHGCCNACVIEANGEQKFACTTKAYDGMEITYDRSDLNDLRKERLAKYAKAIESGETDKNACGCSDTKATQINSSCCSDSSCC
jgi:NADH dehydrogenase/NADH:ubiquinone oxidoreductase subunit G